MSAGCKGLCPSQRKFNGVLKTQELFENNNEILIQHAGSFYKLRITKAGKLILNK